MHGPTIPKFRTDTFMKLFLACNGTNIDVIYILNIGVYILHSVMYHSLVR